MMMTMTMRPNSSSKNYGIWLEFFNSVVLQPFGHHAPKTKSAGPSPHEGSQFPPIYNVPLVKICINVWLKNIE